MEKEQLEKLVEIATKEMDICGFIPDPTGARLLEAARDYLWLLKQPSNTQMHTDASWVCGKCGSLNLKRNENCGFCGERR